MGNLSVRAVSEVRLVQGVGSRFWALPLLAAIGKLKHRQESRLPEHLASSKHSRQQHDMAFCGGYVAAKSHERWSTWSFWDDVSPCEGHVTDGFVLQFVVVSHFHPLVRPCSRWAIR